MPLLTVTVNTTGYSGEKQSSERAILERMLNDVVQSLGSGGPAVTSGNIKANDGTVGGTWTYTPTTATWS